MTEIRGPAPLPSASALRPASASADFALRLLQPLQGLLAPGQSGRAEVIDVRSGATDFQLVLRLFMENGRQATLSAKTAGPVNLGAAVAVTALADNRLLATLQPPSRQPLTELGQLAPGTQIQGRILGQQPQGEGAATRVLVTLLNTPLAGRNLLIDSPQPLAAGSLLTAQVRGNQSLAFLPLSGRLDQLAVGEQLANQFARQGSLQGLLAALGAGEARPAGVQRVAEQLLGLLPEVSQLGNPQKLAQALGGSGLFLEASLLGDSTEALQGDLKAGLLRLVAQLLPGLPGASPLAGAPGSMAGLGQALPAFARQMLGNLGQSPRQQALEFPLPSRLLQGLGEQADLETLLKLAGAAIARLQTHQLASLAQSHTTADGLLLTTWQNEIPMRNGNDILPLQAWIQREEQEPGRGEAPRELLWRIELAFDIPPLGPLQIQAQLISGTFSSQLWAEQPDTARLIADQLESLRERLQAAGLQVGDLSCAQGTPPQGPRTSLEQRFVDETA